jgi:hypothetical protein
MTRFLLFFLSGFSLHCAPAPVDDGFYWSGYVLNDVPGDEMAALSGGTLLLTTPAGDPLSQGEEPDPAKPGYFQVEIETDTAVGIRLSGLDVHPTVWRTHTPPATAWWLNGALFAFGTVALDGILALTEELIGAVIPWRETQEGVFIYGKPTIETQAELNAWTGATVTAIDADYHQGQVALITVEADGQPALARNGSEPTGPNEAEGPVLLMLAWDLAPGPIRMIIDTSDGRTLVLDWVGQDGDVLSAFNLSLPEQTP